MVNIIIDQEKCTGCRACELACSFHHIKSFNRSISSIKVSRDENKREISIMIKETPGKVSRPCDVCYNEAELLCAKYCTMDVLKVVDN